MLKIARKPQDTTFIASDGEEISELEAAIKTLAKFKQQQEAATTAFIQHQMLVLKLMEAEGLKTTVAGDLRATVVVAERLVVNEAKLAKAIGVKAWNSITDKKLNKGKLENAIATGEIVREVLDENSEIVPNKGYVRLSAVEAAHDEAE